LLKTNKNKTKDEYSNFTRRRINSSGRKIVVVLGNIFDADDDDDDVITKGSIKKNFSKILIEKNIFTCSSNG